MTRTRDHNVGWRLDYFFVSPDLRERVVAAEVHANVMGSDHCPSAWSWIFESGAICPLRRAGAGVTGRLDDPVGQHSGEGQLGQESPPGVRQAIKLQPVLDVQLIVGQFFRLGIAKGDLEISQNGFLRLLVRRFPGFEGFVKIDLAHRPNKLVVG